MPDLNFPPAAYDVATTSAVTKYSRRADVYEADGVTVWERDVPIVSGSVTADHTRAERRSANLTLYNEDNRLQPNRNDGFWYDKIVKITMGMEVDTGYWETSIGVFLIDKISLSSDGTTVAVSLRDKSKKLKFPLPMTLSYPENTPFENIIEDLAASAGIDESQYDIPLTGLSTTSEVTFERDKDRFTVMTEIANIHGYELWFDANGIMQLTEFEDPISAQPQYSFQTGTLSNLSKLDRTVEDSLIRNHIVIYGEQSSGDVPVWAEAYNTNPDSPTNIDRMGLRTKTYKSEWVTSFWQAQTLANNVLRYESLEQYDCNLEIVVVPWLEPGIIVYLYDPSAGVGDPTRFLLSSVTINLDLSPASAVVKRVTDVISSASIYPDTDVFPDPNIYPGSSLGRTIWITKVVRSWVANYLTVGSPTWFAERGTTPLTISANGQFTLGTTSLGAPTVQFPAATSVSPDVASGFRYYIEVSGTTLVPKSEFNSTLNSALINGIFETTVALTQADLDALSNWLTHEKFQ